MIAANEQVARLLADRGIAGAVPRPRAARAAGGRAARRRSSPRSTSPTPPVPEHHDAAAGRRGRRRVLACSSTATCAAPAAAARALTSLVLRSLKQAHYSPHNLGHAGPRVAALLPLHLADPPLPRPRLPPRAAVRGGRRRGRAARPARSSRGGHVDDRARARRDVDRARGRRRRALLPARARALRAAAATRSFDGEVIGVIGAGAFVAFGDGHEGLLPVRRLRGDWWELNEQGTILHGTRSGAAIRLGDPVRVRVHRVDAPRGRVDLDLARLSSVGRDGQGPRSARSPPGDIATEPPGVAPLRAARQARVRHRAAGHRGQVAARRLGADQGRLRADPATASCGCTTSTSRPTGRPPATTTSPSARASCWPTAARSSG